MISLLDRYNDYSVPFLKDKFGITNVHDLPYIEKVTISMGIGSDGSDKRLLDSFVKILTLISGSKVVITRSSKSISNFKLRENQIVGLFVTLRNPKEIFNFLCKLVYVSFPKILDFDGFSVKSFDKLGNFSFGVKSVRVFSEINYDDVLKECGLNVSLTLKNCAKNVDRAVALMESLDFPIRKK